MFRQSSKLALAALTGALLLGSVSVMADTDDDDDPVTLPRAVKSAVDGEWACVEPDMRRHHMDLLIHQRHDTMHDGIRTKRHSLKECISCHVTRSDKGEKVSVKSKEHFCNACHSYAAVTLDCFECHASQPDGGQ